jgi:Ankyrin repeats (3 copies)
MIVALAALVAAQAAADAARARKTLEERLVPVTAQELLQQASREEVEVVRLLLEAGVRPDAVEPAGWRAGWTALHHAARRQDGKTLALLLNAGAPVNAQAKDGDTALCVAVGEGYPSNVADLLAARADATLVCREGRTALHEATERAGEPRPSALLVALKDPEPGVRKVAAAAFRSMEAPPEAQSARSWRRFATRTPRSGPRPPSG